MVRILAALLAAATVSSNAYAAVISFEEIPPANANCCFLAEEYAGLGIHFVTTDDGSIWGGLANGDPGNWDLEGTNGPAFLGFNGESYGLTATFDAGVSNFALDVSRSLGSSPGNTFTLQAHNGLDLLAEIVVELGPINTWTTVSLLESNIDRIVWFGSGQGFHPFGVDNMRWAERPVPEPGTLLLLGAGLAGLGAVAWRRHREG